MFTRLVDGPALGSTGTPVTVAVHAVIAVDASNAAVQMAFDLQPYRVGPRPRDAIPPPTRPAESVGLATST
jgi:hypothetical protein